MSSSYYLHAFNQATVARCFLVQRHESIITFAKSKRESKKLSLQQNLFTSHPRNHCLDCAFQEQWCYCNTFNYLWFERANVSFPKTIASKFFPLYGKLTRYTPELSFAVKQAGQTCVVLNDQDSIGLGAESRPKVKSRVRVSSDRSPSRYATHSAWYWDLRFFFSFGETSCCAGWTHVVC